MQFDGTLILVLLSFVGFMLAMRAVYFEPIRRIKAQREALLRADAQEAAACAEQCGQLQDDLEAQLRQARQQAQQQIQASRQSAKDAARGVVAAARESGRRALDEQLAELAQWQAQTYDALEGERQQLTALVMDRVTRRPACMSVVS